MRDQFENLAPPDPVEAARRAARPVLHKRFYGRAAVAAAAGGHAVILDGKPALTPARRALAAPSRALAAALAAEWEAQQESIDPARMPLTRLANAIIDGIAERPRSVTAEIEKYLASDLLCYRAASPAALVQRQQCEWDPILAWSADALGARFKIAAGITYIAQPQQALDAVAAAIPNDIWRLGAVYVITTLTGSGLIALAMAHGRLSAEAAWRAAHVDEDWNEERWGRDQLAAERREFRFAELRAAATILQV